MAHQLSSGNSQTRRRTLAPLLLGLLIFSALACASVSNLTLGANRPSSALQPQETLTGTWTADASHEKSDERIQFTFDRRNREGHMSMSGNGIALGDLQGLTREQVFAGTDTRVSFRLVREAGTIECQGSFRAGRGAGDWRLIPSQSFRDAMRNRGYGDLTDQEMLTSVMVNVTARYADDLKSMGFEHLTYQDVIKGRIFDVTPQFASELKSIGFENLDLEDLIKARIFKIDAEFARQVKSMGFDTSSLEGLVKLRIFKITPEFVREMKAANFENLSAEELVKLRIFQVTPAFVQSMKAEGLSDISVEDAVKLKIHHVDENFIRKARANGYTDLNVEQLVRLSIFGKVK